MKKVTKIMLGIAAFLLMSGGLLAFAGRAMGAETTLNVQLGSHTAQLRLLGLNYYNDSAPWEREYAASTVAVTGRPEGEIDARNLEAFQSIDIDVNMADVEFKEADDYGVKITWNREPLAMEYSTDGGVLSVWSVHSSVNSLGGETFSAKVTVYLPEDVRLDSVSVSVSMGDIDIEDLTASILSAEGSMGEMTLKEITADTLEMTNSMGAMTAEDCTVATGMTVFNSMGDITLSGDLHGSIEVENSMGDIFFSTTAPAGEFGYDLSTSMSTVYVNGKNYKEYASKEGGNSYLQAENSMGDINVSFDR